MATPGDFRALQKDALRRVFVYAARRFSDQVLAESPKYRTRIPEKLYADKEVDPFVNVLGYTILGSVKSVGSMIYIARGGKKELTTVEQAVDSVRITRDRIRRAELSSLQEGVSREMLSEPAAFRSLKNMPSLLYLISSPRGLLSISVAHQDYIENEFTNLRERWIHDTAHLSMSLERSMHDSYQKIIGMGVAVVPLLIRDMQETHTHWFWALRSILRVDPVPAEKRGNVKAMVAAWVEWGSKYGYLS